MQGLLFFAAGILAGVGVGAWLFRKPDRSIELRQRLIGVNAELNSLKALFDERGRAIAKLSEELELARTGATAVGTEWTGRYKKLEAELSPTKMQLVELKADKDRLLAQLTECRRELAAAKAGDRPKMPPPGGRPA